MAKFTKLIKDGSGGSSPSDSRDYYIICYEAWADGNGTLSVQYARYSENPNFVSSGTWRFFGEGPLWMTVPKGEKIKIKASGEGFQYLRSETLGINITTSGQPTDWIELTEDLFDLKIYSYVEMTGGGGSN
jgi:hypothetical protein